MQKIEILVSGKTFTVELFDTEVAQALADCLPMEVTMEELNGNEKYVYLTTALPVAEEKPKCIHAGDLMLFGSKCLVLFYQDFPTSYGYTPLGRVTDTQQLADSLGNRDISVTFRSLSQQMEDRFS